MRLVIIVEHETEPRGHGRGLIRLERYVEDADLTTALDPITLIRANLAAMAKEATEVLARP